MTSKADLPTTRILRRKDWAPDLMSIWLQRPADFDYVPGQYCTIGTGGIERPYSIVSAPHERDIELYIELVPPEHGGNLTPLLWALQPGDSVTLRPRAKGRFTFNPEYKNHLLIATVTGIVPYVSYLRAYFDAEPGTHRFAVLHGASFRNELVYGDEMTALQARHGDQVTYHAAISRPDDPRNQGWTGLRGRTTALCETLAAQHDFAAGETLVYACGNPSMIEGVQAQMGAQGYTIQLEKYWHD